MKTSVSLVKALNFSDVVTKSSSVYPVGTERVVLALSLSSPLSVTQPRKVFPAGAVGFFSNLSPVFTFAVAPANPLGVYPSSP